ncbi:MAG: branched-chain amino acid ABC transporter permease [Actinomycetota bacterium]|nr:branched-chain amino acid ABC transporter permease [Actinomycetota bacterium]
MDWAGILIDGVLATIGPVTAAYAVSAIGLNLQFGYAGLLNFGHVAFMLVGAYGTAITVDLGGPLWLGVIVGVVLATLLGLLLGLPTLRLRADYLAITTIAAAEVIRLLVRSSWAQPLTNGVFGIQGFADSFFDLSPFPASQLYGIGSLVVTGRKLWVMLVGWTLVVLLTLLIRHLIRSPWGRVLKAIREDEDATLSLGKNVFAYKLQALMIGGGIAGISGILLAIEQQNVTPDAYLPKVTFILYVIVILGGAGTILGPVIGAIVFQFLFFTIDALMATAQAEVDFVGNILSPSAAGQVKLVLVGVGLMLLMTFRPQGILGNREEVLIDER